jgi:hypothetical protein
MADLMENVDLKLLMRKPGPTLSSKEPKTTRCK